MFRPGTFDVGTAPGFTLPGGDDVAAALMPEASLPSTRSQRWLALLSFMLAGAAIVILAVLPG